MTNHKEILIMDLGFYLLNLNQQGEAYLIWTNFPFFRLPEKTPNALRVPRCSPRFPQGPRLREQRGVCASAHRAGEDGKRPPL